MPVFFEEAAPSDLARTKDGVRPATDPPAGKQLECPYCGWPYLPEEGCFCVRVVGWDGKPLGH